MSALVSLLAANSPSTDMGGSGLGFYGGAFGDSINVGDYNSKTYLTNSNGTIQGPEVNNVKYLNLGSGILGAAGSGISLISMPNYQASLNIRFTNDTPVKVQNAKLYIYDRVSLSNSPSGVTCKVAQLIHPDPVQTANGSGSTIWITAANTGSFLALANSPGVSGLYAGNGSNSLHLDTQHDFYVAVSAQPSSIGSKSNFGLAVTLEYL